MREFEVLQKVKHENIVKLLAIEEEQVTLLNCTSLSNGEPSMLVKYQIGRLNLRRLTNAQLV